jgi:AGZA family xanthine/uracil permease-like MFS transporter
VIDRLFELERRGSSVRQEVVGGVTTFAAMAYIIVVNPAILAFAGIPSGPGTVATILTAVVGSALMALWANRPIAVAPYMGENAFLAFGLATMGVTWQQRLGTVLVAGVGFAVLVLLGAGPKLASAISSSMKHSFAVGIGLFLLFLGLEQSGIVVSAAAGMKAGALLLPGTDVLRSPPVPLRLGDLHDPEVLLAIGGFLLIVILQMRRVIGAILIGMTATAVVGYALGLGRAPESIFALPFAGALSLAPVAFQLDVPGVLTLTFLPVLLTLFLVSFLDTLGTLLGLGAVGGMLDERGDLPEIERPMMVNALTCVLGASIGTSTSGAYIESATGIREGARTGLAALVTAALFAAALFVIPLVEPLQTLRFAYAPALIAVGIAMLPAARHLDFDDPSELVPAVATIAMMVFSYNIANGLTAGLVLYPLLKVAGGQGAAVSSGSWTLAALCLTYYLFGLPH